MGRQPSRWSGLVAAGIAVTLLGADQPSSADTKAAVLVGAGDIATCTGTNDSATADLLDGIAGTVFTTGDHVYDDGTAEEFANCYHPTWGRHRARTRPTPGNHDYYSAGAKPYFNYFGHRAGAASKGYYSYSLGSWDVVALNSNLSVRKGSAQERWLRADLAANPVDCTVVYWHHPLFSSGAYGGDSRARPIWDALYAAGVDVVVNGHEHSYERFAKQTPTGKLERHGPRQFVVGTGGIRLRPFGPRQPNSVVREDGTWGVLKLTLRAGGYDWRFLPIAGQTFTDSDTATCVDPRPPSVAVSLARDTFGRSVP